MSEFRINRRQILKSAVAAAPLLVNGPTLGRDGTTAPSERVNVGVIGLGIRGRYLIGNLPESARVVGVCDCYQPRIDRVFRPNPGTIFGKVLSRFVQRDAPSCASYVDYRKMLDRQQMDAVVIATPDHHHVLAAMLACQAGRDVYCEKPLSLTIAEGQRLVRAVRRHGRVLQVGSQQRSMEMDRFACQFVREGGLGKISHVEVQNWPSPLPDEALPAEMVPDGMHWDLFCGPTQLRPYNWRYWQKDERQWQGKNGAAGICGETIRGT